MRRVSVVGSSGSGKSTVARKLAARLGLPCLELDSIFHQPNWTPLPDDVFRARVTEFIEQDSWVVDGNYTSHGVADLVSPRADTIVWLDLARSVVMWRVIRRTMERAITREELWNGNREPLTNLYSPDPEKNIIVWAWTRHGPTRAKYEAKAGDGTWDHATVYRLRSQADVNALLEGARAAHRS